VLDEAIIVAEGGGADLEDGLGTFRVVPEHLGSPGPVVDPTLAQTVQTT